jgi:branched-chain amino acid transport system substrate-binding protein
MRGLRKLATAAVAAFAVAPISVFAQEPAPVKIGVITFLSGPAASPFGVPARNSAELMTELLNAGKVPAPYATKGFGGSNIETVIIDEAGGTTTVVTEYRNLVQRHNVDVVIGVIASGDCLAVAPVAEELKKLTNIFDCGTPRLFEDASYKYVFRTGPTSTMEGVAAALYFRDVKPNLKSIAGLNQNYAWGQDSWRDFEASMKQVFPNVQVKGSQMTKLFAGQFNTEISTMLGEKPDVIHSSFWDGDLEALLLQGAPRGLFKKSMGILTTGETAMYRVAAQIPDGTIIGARGPFGPYAPNNELSRWFLKEFQDRYQVPPNYASYKMAIGFLGVKAAWEKAQAANGGKRPSNEQVAAALENLTFEGPGGTVRMALGKGHQAVMEMVYGMSKHVGGKMTVTNVKRYPAEKVNPPEGVKSADWIASGGFKN